MVSDHDRRNLLTALERQLGEAPAATLMELLPSVGWGDLARQSDIGVLRGDLAELRGEMAEVRGEVAELRGEMAELRGEMRSQLPRLYTANVATALATAGLVLAAAKLA